MALVQETSGVRVRRVAIGLLGGVLGLFLGNASHAISVSISDNVVILDNRSRSAQIELLSMTPSAVEFDIESRSLPDGVKDGREYLRWAPERAIVPANRSRPLRMVFRPTADLPPGEYIVRLAVHSREVDYQPEFGSDADEDGEAAENGLAVGVAIQPVLPVTVYIRHQVDSPRISVEEFVPSPADADSHGFFTVRKPADAISFVGTVALVDGDSSERITSGRLRMGQTVTEQQVRVPRREGEGALRGPVCLHLWSEFPPRDAPDQKVCNQ